MKIIKKQRKINKISLKVKKIKKYFNNFFHRNYFNSIDFLHENIT